MSDWVEMRLGEVVTLHYGKSLPANKRIDGNIPVYSSAGLTGWHNKALVKSEALIIGRKGTIGKVYKTKVPFFAIDTSYYILPDIDKYNFDYLFYMLSDMGLDELNEDSAVPGLNRETAYSQEVSLPPLPEQKAIAEVLSSLDDKIDLLHRQNKTLESLAQTLFRQWFIEEAQEGWEEGMLGGICNITGGYAFKSKDFIDDGIPIIKIKNISNNRVKLLDKQFVSHNVALNIHRKFKLVNGDIVMAMTGATIGKVGLVHTLNYDFLLLNQRVAVIRGKQQALLWFLLNAINLEDDILNASNGAAQANISTDGIASVEIPKIDKKLAKKFSLIAEPMFDKILSNQKQIKTLESLRNTLLPKLISGAVRVEFDNNQQMEVL